MFNGLASRRRGLIGWLRRDRRERRRDVADVHARALAFCGRRYSAGDANDESSVTLARALRFCRRKVSAPSTLNRPAHPALFGMARGATDTSGAWTFQRALPVDWAQPTPNQQFGCFLPGLTSVAARPVAAKAADGAASRPSRPSRLGRAAARVSLALASVVVAGAVVVQLGASTANAADLPTDVDGDAPTPVLTVDPSIQVDEALRRLNQERSARGLAQLLPSSTLTTAAAWMAEDMRQQGILTHTDTLGRGLRDRLSAFDYRSDTYISENAARGFDRADDVIAAFIDSPKHLENMLSDHVFAVGIARVAATDGPWSWYWTFDFGSYITSSDVAAGGELSGLTALSYNSTSGAGQWESFSATTRTLVLRPGWNLTGWVHAATSIDVATSGLRGLSSGATGVAAADLFTWDAGMGGYRTHASLAPALLNSLHTLEPGHGIWVFVSDPQGAVWEQPVSVENTTLELPAGYSLVAWNGANGIAVDEAIAAIAETVEAVFVWDADAAMYRTFRPGAPSAVNTVTSLRAGEGVWLKLSAPVQWRQPITQSDTADLAVSLLSNNEEDSNVHG